VITAGAFTGWGPRPNLTLVAYLVLFLAYLGSYGTNSRIAGDEIRAQVAHYGDVAPGRTLEAIIDPGSTRGHPGVQPLLHVAQYQYIEGGTSPLLPPYSPMIHSVRAISLETEQPEHLPMFIHRAFDCSFTPDCATARVDVGRRLGVQGVHFDSVTLVGADSSWGEELMGYGYERAAPGIYIPRPSGVDVTFVEPPHPERQFMIRAGWPDGYGWAVGGGRPPGPGNEEPETARLGPLPAGPIVVETVVRNLDGTEETIDRGTVTLIPGEIVPLSIVE
jgi:hypothetical protein